MHDGFQARRYFNARGLSYETSTLQAADGFFFSHLGPAENPRRPTTSGRVYLPKYYGVNFRKGDKRGGK